MHTTSYTSGTTVLVMICLLVLLPFIAIGAERSERVRNYENIRVRDDIRSHNSIRYKTDEVIVKEKGNDTFTRVRNTRSESIESLLARLAKDENIEYAEPNYVAEAFLTPNDSLYSLQWHFDNDVSGGVEAEEAWDISNGSGVIVAVIDTGVAYEDYRAGFFSRYYQAPDLQNTSFVSGYDFVNNDSHPNDDHGHGTHVAGTIAQSTNNNEGVAGLAYGARIMPIKVLDSRGSGSYADVAEGIRFAADNGAKVINLSLGGSASATYLEDAVNYAHQKGVLVVAAAGNNNSSSVSYPAAYENVVAVGATRFDENRAPYSNYGSALDIVAPGGDTSVDQNNDGYGDGVLQQTFGNSRNDWGYYFYQGTSMAAPHVAAAAAMVIESGVASTPNNVRGVLQNSAKDLGVNGRDDTYGHGLLNVAAALGAESVEPSPPPEEPQNSAPAITTAPVTTANEGVHYSYDVDATDPDGDTLTYNLTQGPAGMTISNNTGLITWAPSAADVGTASIVVEVTDGELSDAQNFEVVVIAAPEPPEEETEGSVLFSDSFENGLGQWTIDSQNDWYINDRRSTDGEESLEVDGRTNDSTITSDTIYTGGASSAEIAFSMYLERSFDRSEYIAFDLSTDGGNTWTEYARLRGNVDPENRWYHMEFTLNNVDELKLRFRAKASSGAEDANVDNVVVTAI